MFHCELVCFLPGRWPSHACRLRGNHWAGSPKPSQNIIWSAPSQKNLFNVFQRKLWIVVHEQQSCSDVDKKDELVKVTRITSGATWPWSTWGHRSSCSSCPPTAGRAPKPREPVHWASPQKHQCKANILRGWSSHHHSCLLHRLKTSIDILHGDVETGLQPHDILSEIYWDTKISTEGISPC